MKEIESTRMKLWCDVYVAYVGAANATLKDGAHAWADVALKRFDEKFDQHIIELANELKEDANTGPY